MRTLNLASIAPVSRATLVSRIRAVTMSGLGLNLPNLISLARLLLVPLEIWLILAGRYGLAFWILVAAGISDALDGFIAKRFDRRTRLGALLDPIADKAMLIGVYVTLGVARQLWTPLVMLVVLRDVMIVGGFLLIQVFAVPKHYDPLYISKLNTGVQIVFVGFVLARLGLGVSAGWLDLILSLAVAATTIVSGFSYLVRWARILARSERAL
jgi:cardiolipin synthase (CMP-forming)